MLYVHIPFCRSKCLYCDFYSVGSRLADWEAFTDAIIAEGRFHADALGTHNLNTIYIGGGTPSLLPEESFRRLAEGLLQLQKDPEEFTVEVNPDDVTHEKSRLWKACGVNRISMGVQSLSDEELRSVGRRHDSSTALRAYEILRKDFDNVSLDLMFGLPGQTIDSLQQTLSGFAVMHPEHISAYSLMYEERTALTKLRDAGRVMETEEDDSARMFELISTNLAENGYEQYEISNYALPGKRSIHNSGYWKGYPYIGLGPSAHSYDGMRKRSYNPADMKRYVQFWNSNPSLSDVERFCETETLTDAELREEMVMTRMRTVEGLSLDEYKSRFGTASCDQLRQKAALLEKRGLVSDDGNRIALTHRGVMVSDDIITSLW